MKNFIWLLGLALAWTLIIPGFYISDVDANKGSRVKETAGAPGRVINERVQTKQQLWLKQVETTERQKRVDEYRTSLDITEGQAYGLARVSSFASRLRPVIEVLQSTSKNRRLSAKLGEACLVIASRAEAENSSSNMHVGQDLEKILVAVESAAVHYIPNQSTPKQLSVLEILEVLERDDQTGSGTKTSLRKQYDAESHQILDKAAEFRSKVAIVKQEFMLEFLDLLIRRLSEEKTSTLEQILDDFANLLDGPTQLKYEAGGGDCCAEKTCQCVR